MAFNNNSIFINNRIVLFFYKNHLALKENNILLENMTNKMSILIEEKKFLENVKPEALIEIVNSSSTEEILIYRICSVALVIVVGVLIYSYSKGTTPPPGGRRWRRRV